MKKRFLSMFSALCLALTLLPPMTAQAAESSAVQEVYIGGTSSGESVGVKLDSTTPYYHNGTDGALGTADDNSTNANATFDPTSGTLTLNDLDIRTNNKGIWWEYNNSGAYDLTIDLLEGTTNTVTNTAGAAIVGDSGFSSGPSLIIKGSGTLNVSGSTSGIWVWQNVTIQGGAKVNATGETKYGICNNSSAGTITMKENAQVTATGATYGIGYDNYDHNANIPVIQGGTVTITGGTAAVRVENGSTESSPDLSGYTVCRVIVGDTAPGTDWNNTTPLSDYKYIKIEPTTHTHSWSDTWNYDETYHWHNCGNNDCYVTVDSSKKGYGEHAYDNAADTDCNTCGYTRTVTPSHTHSWSGTWNSNETHHWHDCESVDCDVTENSSKDSYGEHVYDNDTDLDCNTCGYTRTIAPSHTHSWSATWNYDEDCHWHECESAGCDVTDNRLKDGYASHIGGTATCKDKAICSVCNQPYGSVDSSNHTPVTRDDAAATDTTPGYTGNKYCRDCNKLIAAGERIPATGNTNGSNQPESIAFGYAYNPQTGLIYSREIGNTMSLSDLNSPLLENGSPKEDYAGNWTLTKAGTYSYLKTYLEKNNKDMSNLESVVSTVVEQYGWSVEQKKKSVIYELKDGETHIAYGLILAYDTGRGRAVFVGDNKSGGAGYLLTITELHVSTELGYLVTAVMNAGDFVFESEYHMLEGMNGKWTQNSNATISFCADGDFSKFLGVMVDDSLLDTQKFTAASGSTIVTLKEDYLRTLSVGSHKLTVFYNDGQCSTYFEIQPAVDDSDNGNDTPAPDNGNDTPAPDNGNENPAPDNGNENPAPDNGNDTPAPDNSNENPAADNGNDNPASDNGNDEPAGSPAVAESPVAAIPTYVTHIVQRGDTLRAIARKYGCSVADIVAENKNLIRNVNLIYPGWLLKIPQNNGNTINGSLQQVSISPNAGKTRIHVVKRGDNLWAIARKYGCTSAEIIALNSRLNVNPNLIYAGWELVIPVTERAENIYMVTTE